MKEKEKKGRFEETLDFQMDYGSLLEMCDKLGTMVSQDRVIEKDRDIAPHLFYRSGIREYVFPKQEVLVTEDTSHIVDPNPGYGIRTEKQTFSYDPSLVQGRIKIEYQDADNFPHLKLSDLVSNSKIPAPLSETIERIFQ